MDADRVEMNNLAARQPERVKELAAKWQVWATRCDVLHRPAGKRKPAKK